MITDLTLSIYYHCIVMSLMRPWMGKVLLLRASESVICSPDAIFDLSLRQLKRILILYQLNYPESRYHAFWHPAIIYVSHAILSSSTDKEWRFYFLLCLQGLRILSIVFPFARPCYKGILTIATTEGRLSTSEARNLSRQLNCGDGRGNTRHTTKSRVYLDLSHSYQRDGIGDAEGIAKRFEEVAIVDESTSSQ